MGNYNGDAGKGLVCGKSWATQVISGCLSQRLSRLPLPGLSGGDSGRSAPGKRDD